MQKLLLATLLAGLLTTAQASSKTPLTEQNSFYISAGYGYPNGARGELGYKFEKFITLGLTFGIGDFWSRDPGEGMFGYIAKLRLTSEENIYTPHILFTQGATFSIFGGSDDYISVLAGITVPIKNWLLAQPEVGVVFTGRHISGGSSIFGNSPEVRKKQTWLGVHLNFEIDFARLYNQ
ncbi:MAG: hypothetical protein ACM3U1_07755 [Chloroflexota bacterium]